MVNFSVFARYLGKGLRVNKVLEQHCNPPRHPHPHAQPLVALNSTFENLPFVEITIHRILYNKMIIRIESLLRITIIPNTLSH